MFVCILFNVVLFHFSNDDFHSFSSKKITYMEIFACTRRVNAKACRKGFPVALIAGANQMECHKKIRYVYKCVAIAISQDRARKSAKKASACISYRELWRDVVTKWNLLAWLLCSNTFYRLISHHWIAGCSLVLVNVRWSLLKVAKYRHTQTHNKHAHKSTYFIFLLRFLRFEFIALEPFNPLFATIVDGRVIFSHIYIYTHLKCFKKSIKCTHVVIIALAWYRFVCNWIIIWRNRLSDIPNTLMHVQVVCFQFVRIKSERER